MGCGPSRAQLQGQSAVEAYFAGGYGRAQDRLAELAEKPDENFVLNNLRMGSAALARYDLDSAETALLRAYEVINATGVNAGGRSLGAVLVDEKIKIWKGEPYERALAHFYLGLVYYMRQDWDNARAAFENALFKLRDYAPRDDAKRDAAADQYREEESTFTVALVMLGKAWQQLGREDQARAAFDRAKELRPQLAGLADYDRNAASNVLLVVDYGYGPRKVTDFDGALVGFAPRPFQEGPIPRVQVTVDGRPEPVDDFVYPTIDTLAMAQERRWQSIDTIRATKGVIGTGLMAGGAIAGISGAARENTDTMAIGAGLLAAGLLLKATSHADVRSWEMVPRTVFVIPLKLAPGTHELTVSFPAEPGLQQTWRGVVAPASGEATYYLRMIRWNRGPFDWPPPAMGGAEPSLDAAERVR